MRKSLVIRFGVLLALFLLATGLTTAAPGDRGARVTIRGVLNVIQEDDFTGGRTNRIHTLVETGTGRRIRLHFEKTPAARLLNGSQVVVRGFARDGDLIVGADEDSGVDVASSSAATVSGTRTAVVLVVDFQDSTVSCSDDDIAGLMFTDAQSVDGLYQATSFGHVSLPGDTDGNGQPDVFRVAIDALSTDSCDAYGWAAAAEAAAPGAGANLSLYQHRVFVLPGNTSCGWAGLGNVGCGTWCRAWIKTCDLPDVYAHEIGHNLGMAHASTDTDNDGQVDCEYCDRSDFMGYGGVGWRIVNGSHEDQMGWMPAGQIVEVSEQGTSTHVISPLQQDPAIAPYPQVLKILKQDSGDYYYVTYRQRAGYDATLNSSYIDRTNVHRYVGSGYSNTLFLSALQDGAAFTDDTNGLSVTQLSHDASSATVQIGTTCIATAADVTITPGSQAAVPGTELSYLVSVTNNDAALCDSSTFDLDASVPAGWTGILSPTSLTLEPGQQGQADLSARSTTDSADDAYALGVGAFDPSDSAHQASGSADYVVDGTPPDTVTDLTASIKRKAQVQLLWSAPWDGGSGVAGYRVFRDGAFLDSTSGTSYVDQSTSTGATYSYHVTTLDAVGNESAAGNSAEITVGGGGKGGGGKGGGNKEICDDGVDNDGDGLIDCADSNCGKARVCR